MGKKIVLTGTKITDDEAPILAQLDQIESAGSLYLLDMSHPVAQPAAGVAHGMTIPNVFAANLQELAADSATSPTLSIAGAINNGVKGHFERSGKGGLHGIVSQANPLVSGDGVGVKIAPALRKYINANLSHRFYFSVWNRATRLNPDTGLWVPEASIGGAATTQGILAHATAWISPGQSTPQTQLGSRALGNTLGPRFGYLATGGNGDPSQLADTAAGGPLWGAHPNMIGSAAVTVDTRNGKWISQIAYRFYVEDLTVSGRAFADVAAIDEALFTAAVLTEGGRYYGDTYTDPTTLP